MRVVKAVTAEQAQKNSQLVNFAQALGDPLRVRILSLLLDGKGRCCAMDPDVPDLGVCVCEIMEHLGLAQSKVSYHLAKLKKAGLIKEVRCGKWNYYSVNHQIAQKYVEMCAGFFGGAK